VRKYKYRWLLLALYFLLVLVRISSYSQGAWFTFHGETKDILLPDGGSRLACDCYNHEEHNCTCRVWVEPPVI
jgi:hypothetical protein